MSIHLGGSSRQSLTVGRAALDKTISGATADVLSKLSQDLFVVVNGLGSSISLRRAVTDPARNEADKGALFKEIFGNKISANALELASALATNRWSKPSDLLIALEQIAIEAEAGAANARGELDKLEDEVFAFTKTLAKNQDLRNALAGNPDAVKEKSALVNQVLANATSGTKALITQVVNGLFGRSIEGALSDLATATAARRNLVIAQVRSAVALTEDQKKKLAAALSKQIGQNIRVNVETDPKILGGVSIRFRDELIDGSIVSRMAEANLALAN
jgi:F-type H+-transporting ATPase subunit delta